jgi:hypothetical protein
VSEEKVRLALSLWNLIEIGMAADAAQRERRLDFLEGLNPIWVVERRAIQRQEVERFLWRQKYDRAPKDLTALTLLLSVVDSFFKGARPRVGLTARQFIRETDLASLERLKVLSPSALRQLQDVDRKTRKSQERRVFESWIAPSIPDRDPDGRLLTVRQMAELLAFCWQHKKKFFAACSCLAVEDALTTARTNDANRNPTESDGLDLEHAAVALAYCDIFYSRDAYQAQCATVARKALTTLSLANVCATPAALNAALDTA